MSQEERVFNLQLIIQKLEEELSLYRNGTTAAELMELINEKDVEIETWRAKCDEKDEKLRRLAKTSGDVLLKYERLQEELQKQHNQLQETEFIIKDYNDQILDNENRIKQLEVAIMEKANEMKQKDDTIGAVRLELWDLKQNNDSLVREEKEKYESLIVELKTTFEEKENLLKKASSDSRDNVQMIQMLQSDVQKYKNIMEDQEQSIEKLQKRCATLIAEKSDKLKQLDKERQEMIQHIQQFRESMNQNLAQRDEALRRKDDKLRELQFQISLLQQQLKSKLHRPVTTATATTATVGIAATTTTATTATTNTATDSLPHHSVKFQIMQEDVPESTTAATKVHHHSRVPLVEKTNGLYSTTGITEDLKKSSLRTTTSAASEVPPPVPMK